MDLVIINGASGIARGVTKALLSKSQYTSVKLLDFRPYRQSVYALQRDLKKTHPNVEFKKVPV